MKKLIVGEKTFEIKELSYVDVITNDVETKRDKMLNLFVMSGISKEDAEKLTFREGKIVMDAINQLNGFLDDFQSPNQTGIKE